MLSFLQDLSAPANRHRLLWAVRVRWLVIGGFFALAWAAERAGVMASAAPCGWAAAIGAVGNAVNHAAVARGRFVRLVTGLALPVDVLLISFVVVSTGGIESPFIMMYVVQVVATAMLVNFAAASGTASGCVLCFTIGLWWLDAGLLDGAVADIATTQAGYRVLWAAVLLYCLGLLAFLGGYISERLRCSERDLAEKHARLQATVVSLHKAHGELAATCERLKIAEAQLVHSEKMRALGEFVAGIAHELNNPISFVAANIEHLQRFLPLLQPVLLSRTEVIGAAAEPAVRYEAAKMTAFIEDLPSLLADCNEGMRRATGILAGLRTFARGNPHEAWEAADVRQGMDCTLALVRHRLGSDVQVECDYQTIPLIPCLAGQLEQVFLNLLINAGDAMAGKGRIFVKTMLVTDPPHVPKLGSYVAVSVTDNGSGMSPDTIGHVFDPFFTTKDVGKGTGLGLSVSYGIVARHGGTITVDSVAGRGSTFTVYLPVNPTVADGPSPAPLEPRGHNDFTKNSLLDSVGSRS